MKFAVTGATGYIGERLLKLAQSLGHHVVALSRREPTFEVSQWIPYEINSQCVIGLPAGVDVVFHLATSAASDVEPIPGQELLSTKNLLNASKNIGAIFVFVSSQTARFDAPTLYGRTKWEIEQYVLAQGGCVIRPGQVYGGASRALYGKLVSLVKSFPILPALYKAPQIQPIHVDDLALGMLKCATMCLDREPHIICLGSAKPISFNKFMGLIGSVRLRSRKFFLPLPSFPIVLLVKVFPNFKQLQQLRSLFGLPLMDTQNDLERLGLALRPLVSGLHASGNDRRRNILLEGMALISYLLKENCNAYHLRLYVRAIERLRNAEPMHLPTFFLHLPSSLAVIDKNSKLQKVFKEEFEWRLHSAMLIAEATPAGANRFIKFGERGSMVASLLLILKAVVQELFWKVLATISLPLLKLAFMTKRHYE